MAQLTAEQKKAAFKNQVKKNAKGWKKSREAKPGDFAQPKIEPGRYQFAVTGEYGIGDKGKMKGHAFLRLIYTKNETDDGGEEGEKVTQQYDLSRAATESYDPQARAVQDLKRIAPSQEEAIEQMEGPGDLAEIIDEINNDPPIIWGTITVNEGEGANAGKSFVNIRAEELVEDGATPADPDASDDGIDPDEPEADDDVQVEDEEVQVEDDEPLAWEPSKGEPVSFVNRGRAVFGTLLSVNKAEETGRVKADKDGRTYGPLKWDKLTLIVKKGK